MKKFLSLLLLFCALAAHAEKIQFKADINEICPMSYPSMTGLTDFSFEMRNDSVIVHLPYMGEVYNPSLRNDGLNFSEPCTELTVKPTKKNDGKRISFTVKRNIITYQFVVTLWDNKRIDIFMQPSNAQSCRYSGECE